MPVWQILDDVVIGGTIMIVECFLRITMVEDRIRGADTRHYRGGNTFALESSHQACGIPHHHVPIAVIISGQRAWEATLEIN